MGIGTVSGHVGSEAKGDSMVVLGNADPCFVVDLISHSDQWHPASQVSTLILTHGGAGPAGPRVCVARSNRWNTLRSIHRPYLPSCQVNGQGSAATSPNLAGSRCTAKSATMKSSAASPAKLAQQRRERIKMMHGQSGNKTVLTSMLLHSRPN